MSQPNALEIEGELYPAGMDSTKQNPFGRQGISNEKDNKDLQQKETVEKVQVLENGQPVELLPRGVNDFGLNFLAPGPIYTSNEPERSLRPGYQMRVEHNENDGTSVERKVDFVYDDKPPVELIKDPIEKKIALYFMQNMSEDVIHKIMKQEFGDEYLSMLYSTLDPMMAICVRCGQRLYEHDDKIGHGFLAYRPTNPIEVQEGMKQGTETPMRSDTGDQDWLRRDALQLDSVFKHKYYPIELTNEYPTTIGWIEYDAPSYNKQNANNQPDKHKGYDIPASDSAKIVQEACLCSGTEIPTMYKPLKLLGSGKLELQEAIADTMPHKLKLRYMRKYIYKNKGVATPYNEKKADHICAMLADTVWEDGDPNRPIVPSEGVGYTNTHPNCQCEWQRFVIIDQDEQHFDKMLRPTRYDKPLTEFSWKSKALQKIEDVNQTIKEKVMKGEQLGPVNTREAIKKIQETVTQIRHEFKWLSPEYLNKLRQADVPGAFLLIRASQAAFTDHRMDPKVNEDHRRWISPKEVERYTRTGIGKHADINHDTPLRDPESTLVLDAEYDEATESPQFLVYEEDSEIVNLIRQNKITAVSINAGAPREEPIVCVDKSCSEKVIAPKGLVLGEDDDIAFTYVVTDPRGLYYNGQFIPQATPGVKTTAIEIIE